MSIVSGLLSASKAKINVDGSTAIITVPKHRSFLKKSLESSGEEIAKSVGCFKYRVFISDEEITEDYKVVEFTTNILPVIEGVVGLVDNILLVNEPFSFDFETTSLDTFTAEIVGIGISYSGGTYYLPIKSLDGEHLPLEYVMHEMGRLFHNGPLAIFHNAKYELKILARNGISVRKFYDTMLPVHLENSDNKKSLKKTVERLFHIKMVEYGDVTGKGKKKVTFDKVPLADAADYCGADAYYTYKIYEHYSYLFSPDMATIIDRDIELTKAVLKMETSGILLDLEHFVTVSNKIKTRLTRVEKIIYHLAGEEFNIASTKQLSSILYDKLDICDPIMTKKGNLCTNDKALSEIGVDNKIVKYLMQYRMLTKLLNTYFTLPDKINSVTGRVHGSFNICGTSNFRFSSSNPNLQNIPTKSDYGKEVRRGIIAGPGKVLIAADYSQIELRLFALFAQDEKLLHSFAQGEDPHKMITATLLEKPIEEVTKDDRRLGKTLNFAILYMTGKKKVADMLGIDVEKAQEFITKYYEAIPNLQPLIDSTLDYARKYGYITTIFGRRRYFPSINSKHFGKRHAAEREAFNATIQAAAAEVMRNAMIQFDKVCPTYARMLLTVHDELVVECDEDKAEEVKALLVHTMETATQVGIRLEVEANIAKNYGDAK